MNIVPLPATQLAAIAPNWIAMRSAIAVCERLDEVRSLSDKAMALRAYFAQSQDVENEVAAMRCRLRAERRLGELIAAEQEAGRLASRDSGNRYLDSSVTRLSDVGIPYDRSARAQKLAAVPEAEFEAALESPRPSARALAALAPSDGPCRQSPVDIEPVLKTWGVIRDFAAAIGDGSLLPAQDWRRRAGVQQFQVAEICAAIPVIVRYLTELSLEE